MIEESLASREQRLRDVLQPAMRKLVEVALAAEVSDALGRGGCERSASGARGCRNRQRAARRKMAEGSGRDPADPHLGVTGGAPGLIRTFEVERRRMSALARRQLEAIREGRNSDRDRRTASPMRKNEAQTPSRISSKDRA